MNENCYKNRYSNGTAKTEVIVNEKKRSLRTGVTLRRCGLR